MDFQAYDEFIKILDDMTTDQMRFLGEVKDTEEEAVKEVTEESEKETLAEEVKEAVKEAKELGSYGEQKIALENLLENLIEIGLILTPEQICLAEQAIGKKSTGEQRTITYYKKHLVRND